ncbi:MULTISPECIES: SAM-dependent methyltransferase [unclassified Heyndrickxia]|uniref:SAM-dependent methyltransferase n=2 Tax=Heyndrickxia TaxID=2837504 RepID=UPI0030FAB963
MITKVKRTNDYPIPFSDGDKNFFDSTYQQVYSQLLDREVDDQIRFLKRNLLNEIENPHILDFCCGHGRHLLRLWRDGYSVHGLDINEDYLKLINQKTSGEVTTFLADGRYFKSEQKYNVLLNMETSIGYLNDDENFKMLECMYSCLNSNGKLLLHLANREYLIKNFNPLVWFGNEQIGFSLERRTLDLQSSSLSINQTRIIDNKVTKYNLKLRLYSLSEIASYLKQVGFNIENVFGDFSESKYSIESPSIILICTK